MELHLAVACLKSFGIDSFMKDDELFIRTKYVHQVASREELKIVKTNKELMARVIVRLSTDLDLARFK